MQDEENSTSIVILQIIVSIFFFNNILKVHLKPRDIVESLISVFIDNVDFYFVICVLVLDLFAISACRVPVLLDYSKFCLL